jgi:catechol 2,3-dioxygenase-like lactoylglutathione lyase family enzyme
MRVSQLDHVNIVTDDLPGTAKFYADLLDLEARDGPPPSKPEDVKWMYDDAGRPILHLNRASFFKPLGREAKPGPDTGALHHVALRCEGHEEMIKRLKARGLEHAVQDIGSIGLKQIFVVDPNGVLLELNFFGG